MRRRFVEQLLKIRDWEGNIKADLREMDSYETDSKSCPVPCFGSSVEPSGSATR
jgi:hypothetical protein